MRRKQPGETAWWVNPLAMLLPKLGVSIRSFSIAIAADPALARKWLLGANAPQNMLAHGTILRLLQHGSSRAGEGHLRYHIAQAARQPTPVKAANYMLGALYSVEVAPVDYSWARFIEIYGRQVRLMAKPPMSFKDMEEWIWFTEEWRHPRQIAARLDLPDPGLPDYDDTQEYGELEWNQLPNSPPQNPDPNPAPPAPPAPPAGTG